MGFGCSIFNHLAKLLGKRRPSVSQRVDLVLGVSMARDASQPLIFFPDILRMQHLGILGLSGTGKTHLIEHMIRQDIQNGNGFALFDVHGDLADGIVGYLAEQDGLHPEVYERTVIIEPFDPNRTFGFNPLEQSFPDVSISASPGIRPDTSHTLARRFFQSPYRGVAPQ
jgi:hypothetical protein